MKRGAVIGIVVGAVVVVGVGGVTAWALTRPESAESAAARYVQALEEGDRAVLSKFLEDTPTDRERLLDLFDAATGRIADAKVSAPESQGGLEGFRADVTLDGEPGVISFMLGETSGQWRLAADYLAGGDVTTTIGNAVSIGDVTVPTGTVSLLPAVYTLRPAPSDVLAGETIVAATNETTLDITVEASLSPDASAVVQKQLDAYAAACAKPATAVPPNCGLKVPWGADLAALKSLDFRIEKTPQVTLSPDATSFDATGGVIIATARGTARSGGEGTFTYRADDWALRGALSFDAAQLVLAVR